MLLACVPCHGGKKYSQQSHPIVPVIQELVLYVHVDGNAVVPGHISPFPSLSAPFNDWLQLLLSGQFPDLPCQSADLPDSSVPLAHDLEAPGVPVA